jgi:osmoprotectant transport system permease protein
MDAATILPLALEHLLLTAITIAIATFAGVGAGLALVHRPVPRRAALAVVNILQTIPSLALFGFLIPIPLIGGIGPRTAVVALVLYALLPIVRNTTTGILQIDPAIREAALAMGMTTAQRLRLVGIRVATVATIGTATIAAAIGAGGLGVLIFRGLASVNTTLILSGAVPAAMMALTADALLAWIEEKLSPR